MKNINNVFCQLLGCWRWDLEFLGELLEAYNLEIDIDEISMNYWKVDNINILIYDAYTQIKDMFIEENAKEIKTLWFDIDVFEEWEDYEIHTNYMASTFWFMDDKVNKLYDKWRKD